MRRAGSFPFRSATVLQHVQMLAGTSCVAHQCKLSLSSRNGSQGMTSEFRLQRPDIIYSSSRRTSCFTLSCNKNTVSSATTVSPSRRMGATWPTTACCRNAPERGGATSSQPRRPRPMLKIVQTVNRSQVPPCLRVWENARGSASCNKKKKMFAPCGIEVQNHNTPTKYRQQISAQSAETPSQSL